MILSKLNTHLVGNLGLIGGSATILGATAYLFKVLSDPDELVGLYEAAKTHTDPTHAVANLAGAGIAIVGALVVTYLAAYLGRPTSVPK